MVKTYTGNSEQKTQSWFLWETFLQWACYITGYGENKASAGIAQYPTKKAFTGSTIDSLSRIRGLGRTDAATIFEYVYWSDG